MHAQETISVAIADDHALMCDGLRLILGEQDGIEVVGQAADLDSMDALLARCEPSILLLDVNLGDDSGLAAVGRLTVEHPGTAVIILTMQKDPAAARRALGEGASGYILKDGAARDLVRAIRTVARGGTYVEPELAAALLRYRAARSESQLTEREGQVLGLIAAGYTNGEIAHQLVLSVRTVESHRARIQQKLGLSSRAELVRYAHEHGLTDL